MRFSFKDILEATNATVLYKSDVSGAFELNTDTRTISTGEVFIPIVGQNFDGHEFVEEAVSKGIVGYFTSDESRSVVLGVEFVLYVEDTTRAYLQLASLYRKRVNPVVIAITGSSGKTTIKEMMASVAQQVFKTYKTKLNHNNEMGLAQTILAMPKDTEVLVLEMGMRGLGEIAFLCEFAKPDIAVIANVGTAHIGRLKTVRNITKAKCEIAKHLHQEGVLIAHDDLLIRSYVEFKGHSAYFSLDSENLKEVKQEVGKSDFVYKGHAYSLLVEGSHNIQNALAVIEAGLRLGIAPDKIAAGLASYRTIEKRWEIENVGAYKIINDSYNANPDSMRAVIDTFLKIYPDEKCLVLGDMGELGKDEKMYHKKLGEYLKHYSNVNVLCVGKLAQYIAKRFNPNDAKTFANNQDCAKYILENIPDGTTILLKASRSMHFEQIIEEIRSR